MVMYRFGKHHKPKQQKKPQPVQVTQKQKEQIIIEEDKPIEIKIINGKKVEIHKYRL